jgi:lipoyl-dependent peroxiredoxin
MRLIKTFKPIISRTFTFKPLYSAECTATGGRNGHVKSSDGIVDLKMTLPKSLGGPGGAHANPELLFAAGYSSCFTGLLC